DPSGNTASLAGSFESLDRDVDVCSWRGCKRAAASWSIDDSRPNCFDDLAAAGFKGTYFNIRAVADPWWAPYSAAGHEIAAHTTSHPCNLPCCGTACTQSTLHACPSSPSDVDAY